MSKVGQIILLLNIFSKFMDIPRCCESIWCDHWSYKSYSERKCIAKYKIYTDTDEIITQPVSRGTCEQVVVVLLTKNDAIYWFIVEQIVFFFFLQIEMWNLCVFVVCTFHELPLSCTCYPLLFVLRDSFIAFVSSSFP